MKSRYRVITLLAGAAVATVYAMTIVGFWFVTVMGIAILISFIAHKAGLGFRIR